MMLSKVQLRPVLKVITPARKPMPSTIASVLISRRTLRASRLRQVRRSTSARRLLDGGSCRPAILARIWSRSGSRSSSTIRPSARKSDAVGVRRRDRVVGHHHDGLAELVDAAAQEAEHLGAAGGVEVAGGLVGEDDRRLADQRAGAGDALLLAARHLARLVAEPRRRPTASTTWSNHARSGLRPARLSGSRMFSSAVRVGHQVEGLEDEADPLAAQGGEVLVLELAQRRAADDGLAGRSGCRGRPGSA